MITKCSFMPPWRSTATICAWLPLSMRKANLDRLLPWRPDGLFNPFERGEIGPDLFRAACDLGLQGLVSKHRDRPYQSGRSKHWVKTKNRAHPAMERPRRQNLAKRSALSNMQAMSILLA